MGKMRPKLGRHIDPSGLSGVLKTDGTTVTAEEQLALVRGGTGATTAAAALSNLGGASAADLAAHAGRTDNPHDLELGQLGGVNFTSLGAPSAGDLAAFVNIGGIVMVPSSPSEMGLATTSQLNAGLNARPAAVGDCIYRTKSADLLQVSPSFVAFENSNFVSPGGSYTTFAAPESHNIRLNNPGTYEVEVAVNILFPNTGRWSLVLATSLAFGQNSTDIAGTKSKVSFLSTTPICHIIARGIVSFTSGTQLVSAYLNREVGSVNCTIQADGTRMFIKRIK